MANLNNPVISPGGVLDLLNGIHRDTGVRVGELALAIHEHAVNCAGCEKRNRCFVEFLGLERYGPPFERFIEIPAPCFASRRHTRRPRPRDDGRRREVPNQRTGLLGGETLPRRGVPAP